MQFANPIGMDCRLPLFVAVSVALLYFSTGRHSNNQPLSKMSFRLHLVRHAEGTHNLGHDTTILDPPLTANGVEQSQSLCRDFPYHDSVGLVLASPLRRTLQTAHLGFQNSIDERFYAQDSGSGVSNGAELVLEPEVQAHSARPCDTGSEIAVLRSEFHDLPWETMQLDTTFPEKTGLYAPDAESLRLRGARIQRQLKERFQELAGTNRPDIVVVTHGGFLRFVSGDDRIGIGQARWKTMMVTFDQNSGIVIESSE